MYVFATTDCAQSIRADLVERLKKVYPGLPIGDPRDETTLVGPLTDKAAGDAMLKSLASAKSEGGVVHGAELQTSDVPEGGVFAWKLVPLLIEKGLANLGE